MNSGFQINIVAELLNYVSNQIITMCMSSKKDTHEFTLTERESTKVNSITLRT